MLCSLIYPLYDKQATLTLIIYACSYQLHQYVRSQVDQHHEILHSVIEGNSRL